MATLGLSPLTDGKPPKKKLRSSELWLYHVVSVFPIEFGAKASRSYEWSFPTVQIVDWKIMGKPKGSWRRPWKDREREGDVTGHD